MRECAALILILPPAIIANGFRYAAILEMWYNRFGSTYCCGDIAGGWK